LVLPENLRPGAPQRSDTQQPGYDQTDTCLMAYFLEELGSTSTRKVKPIWILLQQEMMGWQ